MSYPHTFTDRHMAFLGPVIPVLKGLTSGRSATLGAATPQETAELRYLVYAWLSPLHSNRKHEFRVSTINSTQFMVTRLGGASSTYATVLNEAEPGLSAELEALFFEHGLDEIESEELLAEKLQSLDLSDQDKLCLAKEWARIHSEGETS